MFHETIESQNEWWDILILSSKSRLQVYLTAEFSKPINQLFQEHSNKHFSTVNREQDLDDKGLSEAKLSFHPEDSIKISADIYADLRKKGELIEDIDILIAGIAISNNLVLVTKNKSHFSRIKKLNIEDWSIP